MTDNTTPSDVSGLKKPKGVIERTLTGAAAGAASGAAIGYGGIPAFVRATQIPLPGSLITLSIVAGTAIGAITQGLDAVQANRAYDIATNQASPAVDEKTPQGRINEPSHSKDR